MMIELIFYLLIISAILYLLYKVGTKNYDYFEKQGIKHVKPYPFIGTNYSLLMRIDFIELIIKYYQHFKNERLYGTFDFLTPRITIRDPELVKQITIKDFDHFTDHLTFFDSSVDEMFGSVLNMMKGKRWREMRSTLSPAFTGNKMRLMCELMTNCGQQLANYIKEQLRNGYSESYDIKDIFSKYTNDVIATCAFGLKCDSLKNPNNEFYQIGQSFKSFQKPFMMILFIFMSYFPKLSYKLGIRLFNKKTTNKFREMIIETMEIRKEKGIVRPDMINILMELKNNAKENSFHETDESAKKSWTDIELIAQCFLFFLAGFETSSQLMTFIAYELAVNQDVQKKLIEEIDANKDLINNESVKYDYIQKMKYMDMVISETLRKWPPALGTDRICTKDYTYESEDGQRFTIEKGMMCFIPIIAFHRDPKYFENPDKFDPERFNDENKTNINTGAYIPFGIGPRNCIGSRFALLETKFLLFHILCNFEIEISGETEVPLKLKKSVFALVPEKPITLRFKERV